MTPTRDNLSNADEILNGTDPTAAETITPE